MTSKRLTYWLGIGTAVILLAILQYRLWFDDTGLLASRSLQSDISSLEKLNDDQRNQNADLLNDINGLTDDGPLVEEIAREELGLVQPDETFILLLDSQP